MKRRDFLFGVGGTAFFAIQWRVYAQESTPVIGFLDSGAPEGMETNLAGFHAGLAEIGFIEGKNVSIEYRWARGKYNDLPALATELVHRNVSVIAATRSSAPAFAAKAATSKIPIVFQTGSDPVREGLVASFNRPGSNVTGATRMTTDLTQKRLGILTDLVPSLTTIAILTNPAGRQTAEQVQEMQAATMARHLKLYVAKASSDSELDTAFAALSRAGAMALIIGSDNLFIDRRKHIVALTLKHSLPTIFFERDSVVDGGLMSYSASLAGSFRQVGAYVGRILKGEKPSDMPVLQPTKFDFILNLKTAKALSLTIPPLLLAAADEVIE